MSDLARLYPEPCRCHEDDCDRCMGMIQLTPRTAFALIEAALCLSDFAEDDIDHRGDAPVDPEQEWHVFDLYPRITWRQNREWRVKAAKAFQDLRQDLESGKPPIPRTTAEEMALHLMLGEARECVEDWLDDGRFPILPSYPEDFDWDEAESALFQDTDILDLFDAQKDGVEDPDSDLNRGLGIGDLRPETWFKTFLNRRPRESSPAT